MKKLTIILSGLALLLASCGSNTEQATSDDQSQQDSTPKKEAKHANFVYSLYKNVGKLGYQIYKNNEKFAAFSLEEGRQPISMRIYSGECFILVSGCHNDTSAIPSQIYKNGKPAMSFHSNFEAADFDISNGHFYVLGHFGDTLISVFKDGLKDFDIREKGCVPTHICISNESAYYTLEKDGVTSFYRDSKELYSIDGKCQSFQTSALGNYSYINGKIYAKDTVFFDSGVHYRFFDNDLVTYPVQFSISDSICYVASYSKLNDTKSYAAIFQNNEHLITVKPDDKLLGKSENETVCRGITACKNGAYYVTENVCPQKSTHENVYHYYFNSEELFQIEPVDSTSELLMIKGW